MKVIVAHVHPDVDLATYNPMARRFVETYMDHPPGQADHELVVLVNHGHPHGLPGYRKLFEPLACSFMLHDNTGKDIGAYQMAAREIPCDLLVCLGAPVYFPRAGWLDRIVNTYEQNGPGLYGPWGFHQPKPHIRTTAFWCAPELLNSYPYVVHNDSRYEFEHGDKSITAHVTQLGLPAFMVTWDGCHPMKGWHHASRAQSLMLDQHSDRNKLQ